MIEGISFGSFTINLQWIRILLHLWSFKKNVYYLLPSWIWNVGLSGCLLLMLPLITAVRLETNYSFKCLHRKLLKEWKWFIVQLKKETCYLPRGKIYGKVSEWKLILKTFFLDSLYRHCITNCSLYLENGYRFQFGSHFLNYVNFNLMPCINAPCWWSISEDFHDLFPVDPGPGCSMPFYFWVLKTTTHPIDYEVQLVFSFGRVYHWIWINTHEYPSTKCLPRICC